jgi:type IV pilus assembly protein PilB
MDLVEALRDPNPSAVDGCGGTADGRYYETLPGIARGCISGDPKLARKSKKKIGEILIDHGSAAQDQIVSAITAARDSGKRVGEVLVEQGVCTEVQVAKALAEQFGVEFVDLSKPEAATKIDRSLLKDDLQKKFTMVSMRREKNTLLLLVHDPLDLAAIDAIGMTVGKTDVGGIASRTQLAEYISGATSGPSFEKQLVTSSIDRSRDASRDSSRDASRDSSLDSDAGANESGIVRLVDRLIVEAVQGRASDIHVEPYKDKVILRYRIDGVCIVRDEIPKKMQNQILARLKLMAGVNISERRIPQDGRIKMTIDGTVVDFRVSACPAVHGESVVLRILRPDSARLGLEKLGFQRDNLDNFNRIIRRPNGIFLVTGPTGSGKTTTLYSALNDLNTPDRKIITAEDPVEYAFKGINQVQVRESIGLTFSAILKSMLRQAPNIILVGEIRDREVADIAIQAALTGHMVFSTLHTNDAPSAITRLIDMGVKPFLVASSIQAVMGQRLVRILCEKCKQPDDAPDRKVLRLVGINDEELANGRMMKPVGCDGCGGTGYRGRRAIFELMTMNSEIRDLAFNRSSISKLRNAAIRGGMRSLVEDGKIKILRGETTASEIANFAQIEGFDPTEIGHS